MSRYARQITLPKVGISGQRRLGEARVLIIGAGGLAAPLVPLLAGAGVGRLHLMDGDTIEKSNLQRQFIFTDETVGAPKAKGLATHARRLNPDCTAVAETGHLTAENAPEQIANADVVVDCADSYAASYLLSDLCHDAGKPLFTASVLGFTGYAAGVCGGAPSLRALFPDAPGGNATCASAGVMGPVVSTLGSLQAQMVLNHLLGLNPSPLGQLIEIDGQTLRSHSFRFESAAEPDQPPVFVSPRTLGASDLLVELRSVEEAPTPIHPSAKRLQLAKDILAEPPAPRIALACATGLRAWRMAEEIKEQTNAEIVLVAASIT